MLEFLRAFMSHDMLLHLDKPFGFPVPKTLKRNMIAISEICTCIGCFPKPTTGETIYIFVNEPCFRLVEVKLRN